jgi:hypothetical protein
MAYYLNVDRFGNEIIETGAADVVLAPISYVPTSTGNASNKNNFVIDPNGEVWFIDTNGDAVKVNAKDIVTTLTNVVSGNKIGTYTNELGVVVDIFETITTLTATITGHKIGTYTNESGTAVDIKETITTLVDNGDSTFTYTNENGVPTIIQLKDKCEVVPYVQNITSLVANGDGTYTFTNEEGVKTTFASSAGSVETVTHIINTIVGHKIGDYVNESGVSESIYETITSLSDFSIAGNVISITYIDESGVPATKTLTIPSDVVTTLTNAIVGHKIGTYTNESGVAVDINETITTITNALASGHKVADYTNEDGVVVTINETITTLVDNGNGTATYTNESGAAVTIPLSAPFKNLNEWHVDPNGSDSTGTGAQEKPFKTIAKALTMLDQGDQVIVHASEYTENLTMSVPNTAIVGAQGEYGSLTNIVGSITVTASSTSCKISNLTFTSLVDSGTGDLYLNEVTINSTLNSSAGYLEIKNSSIQTGAITKSAGNMLIENSKIQAVNVTGGASVIRDSYQEGNSTVTFGAGVVYGIYNLQGGEVSVNASAIPIETAALAQGLSAEMSKEAETSDFMKLGMLRPDTEAAPTKVVTWDEVTGRLEVSNLSAIASPSALWVDAVTDPSATGNTGTLPRFVNNTANGSKWYIDASGVAKLIEGGADSCGVVYFDSVDPSAATIFDTQNPPVTNNNALKNLDCALYIGTDGSVWTSNGTSYSTKVYSVPLHNRDLVTATAGQTAFTISKVAIGSTEKVHVTRNGIDISHAWTWVGTAGTYIPASNASKTMDAGDRVIFHYEAN